MELWKKNFRSVRVVSRRLMFLNKTFPPTSRRRRSIRTVSLTRRSRRWPKLSKRLGGRTTTRWRTQETVAVNGGLPTSRHGSDNRYECIPYDHNTCGGGGRGYALLGATAGNARLLLEENNNSLATRAPRRSMTV